MASTHTLTTLKSKAYSTMPSVYSIETFGWYLVMRLFVSLWTCNSQSLCNCYFHWVGMHEQSIARPIFVLNILIIHK